MIERIKTYLIIFLAILVIFLYFKSKYNFKYIETAQVFERKVEKIKHKFKVKYKDRYIPVEFYYINEDGNWEFDGSLAPDDLFIDHDLETDRRFAWERYINFGISYKRNGVLGYNMDIFRGINAGVSTNFKNIFLNAGYRYRNISANIGINTASDIIGYITVYPFR